MTNAKPYTLPKNVHTEHIATFADRVDITMDSYGRWGSSIHVVFSGDHAEIDEVICGFASTRNDSVRALQNALNSFADGLRLAGDAMAAEHVEHINRHIEQHEDGRLVVTHQDGNQIMRHDPTTDNVRETVVTPTSRVHVFETSDGFWRASVQVFVDNDDLKMNHTVSAIGRSRHDVMSSILAKIDGMGTAFIFAKKFDAWDQMQKMWHDINDAEVDRLCQ